MTAEADSRASLAPSTWRGAAILLIVLLGFGPRVYPLDHESLWVDEATNVHLATLSPKQIVLDRADGLHSPLYSLALAAWTNATGQSEFSLRFFPVWTGLLLVPIAYHTCPRHGDRGSSGTEVIAD